MLRRLFIAIFYLLSVIALIAVFLVVLFPTERALDWVESSVERELPGFSCAIKDARYVHPLKLRFYQVILSKTQGLQQIRLDTLLVAFDLWQPFERFTLAAVLYGGIADSELLLDRSSGRIEVAELRLDGFRLADFAMLQQLIDRPVAGTVSFSGSGEVAFGESAGMSLRGSIRIADFTTPLRRPIWLLDTADFTEVVADLVLDGNNVGLSEGEAVGPDVMVDFGGRIGIRKPWSAATVDLAGEISPQSRLFDIDPQTAAAAARLLPAHRGETIPFRLEGTLADPQLRLGPEFGGS